MVTLSSPKTLVFDLRESSGIEVSQLEVVGINANDDLKFVRALVRPVGVDVATPPTWIKLESFSDDNYTGLKSEAEVESALVEQLS